MTEEGFASTNIRCDSPRFFCQSLSFHEKRLFVYDKDLPK